MRLIDADALEKEIHDALKDGDDIDGAYILNTLDVQPTVEAVPMRRTKPVMGVSRDWLQNWWQCGNCESVIEQGDRYCRGCGAEVVWDGAIT